MMESLLDVVIQVLQTDEQEGQASLESLIELTQSNAEIWNKCIGKLVYVCSEIMKNQSFEQSPRQSALEIISTLAEASPKILRDQITHLQKEFFPALATMMTQVEHADDLQLWADTPEEEILTRNDASSIAAEALERISEHLGDKTTIACSSSLIHEAVNNKDNWQYRQAGYMFLGMIAESCSKTFKKNIDDTVRMSAMGLMDEHPRVRYQALMALGLLLNVMSPQVQ